MRGKTLLFRESRWSNVIGRSAIRSVCEQDNSRSW